MERVEFDPEIDPSIREEREAAEREREFSARVRLEIERYVEENDLVPRESVEYSEDGDAPAENTPADDAETDTPAEQTPRQKREREREAKRLEKAEKRDRRAADRKKAVRGVITGGILGSERVRKMLPYLLALGVLLILYIAHTFHLQKLHLEQQKLERQVRELSIEAVWHSADRVRETRRSAIVRRLEQQNIPLREFPHPVKKIDK